MLNSLIISIKAFWLLRCTGITIDSKNQVYLNYMRELHRSTLERTESLRTLRGSKHVIGRYAQRYYRNVKNFLHDARDTYEYLCALELRVEPLKNYSDEFAELYRQLNDQRQRCVFYLNEIESQCQYIATVGGNNVLRSQQSEQYHFQ